MKAEKIQRCKTLNFLSIWVKTYFCIFRSFDAYSMKKKIFVSRTFHKRRGFPVPISVFFRIRTSGNEYKCKLDQVNSANLLFELLSLAFYVLICYRIVARDTVAKDLVAKDIDI